MIAQNIFHFHEYTGHLFEFEFFFLFYNEKLLQNVIISWFSQRLVILL